MRDDKKISPQDIEDAQVHLKPLMGIPVRVWLPCLYGLGLAALFFAIFVLPGIQKNGAYLALSGTPSGIAVYVDSAYRGGSDSGRPIFLTAGEHTIEFKRAGFASESRTVRVGGRLLGSLFFPRHYKVSYALKPEAPDAALAQAFADYAAWASTGKPSAVYQTPMALSDSLMALASAGVLGSSAPHTALAGATLSAACSAQAAKDAIRATLIDAGAGIPSPLGLIAGARSMIAAISAQSAAASAAAPQSNLALWLNDILPATATKARTAVDASLAAAAAEKAATPALAAQSATQAAGRAEGSLTVAGIKFVRFAGGRTLMAGQAPSGSNLPYSHMLPVFALAATETTVGQWAAFIAANPQWAPDQRASLVEKGWADEAYMVDWAAQRAKPALPVSGISWYAAQAYCDWLSARAGALWKLTLPSEAMWETAAQQMTSLDKTRAVWGEPTRSGPSAVAQSGYDSSGIADLLGNLWEWTADSFLAYPAFAGQDTQAFAALDKAVRGGSWANAETSVSIQSRGAIPAQHASAFLGFRPALVALTGPTLAQASQ